MNCIYLEKIAGSFGTDLGRATFDIFQTIGKHPKTTLGIIGALAGLGIVANYANRVRGLHQIMSSGHKNVLMNQQTELLNRIATAVQRSPESPKSTMDVPITPPLR